MLCVAMLDPLLARELERLQVVLAQHGETDLAQKVHAALHGSKEDLRAFLMSNDLWGGAGSIADQAGAGQGRQVRREIEAVLCSLGVRQMQHGVVNVRTAMWVDAFLKWQRERV